MNPKLKEELQTRAREIDNNLQTVLTELAATEAYVERLKVQAKKLCKDHAEQVHKVFRFDEINSETYHRNHTPSKAVKMAMYKAFELMDKSPFELGKSVTRYRAVVFWWVNREMDCTPNEIWSSWKELVGDQEKSKYTPVGAIIEVAEKSKDKNIISLKSNVIEKKL